MINKTATKIWIDVHLQLQTNKFKTICPIYVKLPTALFNYIYRSLLQEEYVPLLRMS